MADRAGSTHTIIDMPMHQIGLHRSTQNVLDRNCSTPASIWYAAPGCPDPLPLFRDRYSGEYLPRSSPVSLNGTIFMRHVATTGDILCTSDTVPSSRVPACHRRRLAGRRSMHWRRRADAGKRRSMAASGRAGAGWRPCGGGVWPAVAQGAWSGGLRERGARRPRGRGGDGCGGWVQTDGGGDGCGVGQPAGLVALCGWGPAARAAGLKRWRAPTRRPPRPCRRPA